jgi:hypothetical protein
MSGLVAGTAGAILGHPIDTVRVNVITTGKGALRVVREITAANGLRGFLRGIVPPLTTNGIGERDGRQLINYQFLRSISSLTGEEPFPGS